VFVKGVEQDSLLARMSLNEVRTNPLLHASAPRLLWTVETMEWLVLGYEYVPGRHPDFSPHSPDLPLVLALLAATTEHVPADLSAFDSLAAKWERVSPWCTLATKASNRLSDWERSNLDMFLDREAFITGALALGNNVVHSDVHELNMLVSDGDARLIDWAWACRAPAWVDPAFWVVRLVGAGHDPRQAERLAQHIPAWRDAPGSALTAFAIAVLGMWQLRGRFPHLVQAAQRYAFHRLEEQ
jgi:Ser/Thr protein kinase RdoA (MazF antagonist)